MLIQIYIILQSFKQHTIEPDPERVKMIMEKAFSDAKWILQKVFLMHRS